MQTRLFNDDGSDSRFQFPHLWLLQMTLLAVLRLDRRQARRFAGRVVAEEDHDDGRETGSKHDGGGGEFGAPAGEMAGCVLGPSAGLVVRDNERGQASAWRNVPDLPPDFSSSFTSSMIIPRSTALHMS